MMKRARLQSSFSSGTRKRRRASKTNTKRDRETELKRARTLLVAEGGVSRGSWSKIEEERGGQRRIRTGPRRCRENPRECLGDEFGAFLGEAMNSPGGQRRMEARELLGLFERRRLVFGNERRCGGGDRWRLGVEGEGGFDTLIGLSSLR
ncbi:hypothetical protein KM043_003163 [Ampulex compressa]|nr:hypothetical protein KM043_003163 [Ampulex compressa]